MKTSLMKAFPRQRLLRFSSALLLVSLLTLVGATQAPRARAAAPDPATLVLTASAPGAPVYGTVTLTATATDATGKLVSGVDVQFSSSSLKNQPAQYTVATDGNGQATLAYTDKAGEQVTDLAEATFTDALTNQNLESNLAPVQWVDDSFITLSAAVPGPQTGLVVLTATVIGPDGKTSLTGASVTLTVYGGTNPTVGTADSDANRVVDDYQAMVSWGDGASSTLHVSIDRQGNLFLVAGIHTYAEKGAYQIALTIRDTGRSSVTTIITIAIK